MQRRWRPRATTIHSFERVEDHRTVTYGRGLPSITSLFWRWGNGDGKDSQWVSLVLHRLGNSDHNPGWNRDRNTEVGEEKIPWVLGYALSRLRKFLSEHKSRAHLQITTKCAGKQTSFLAARIAHPDTELCEGFLVPSSQPDSCGKCELRVPYRVRRMRWPRISKGTISPH